jgi:hypothetical protein
LANVDAQAQAVQTLLEGLGLKRKQELIERNDRLRMQFIQTQKMPAGKARDGQLNAFLANVVLGDRKMRELVFSAWFKDHTSDLGLVPEFPESFKRDAETASEESESDIKEAAASLKKWSKETDFDWINVYTRVGPYEFPAKVLSALKKPKPKETPQEAATEGEETSLAGSGISEAVVAELRREMEKQRETLEAKAVRQEEETNKFKRLLEENKDKRKAELNETQEKSRLELVAKQAEWQRLETQLKRDLDAAQKAIQDQSDKTIKVRDELSPLRQQFEKAERDAKRALLHAEEAKADVTRLESEKGRLADRLKVLESAQQQLISKEKQLQRFERLGSAVAITSTDNLRIWEEALNEQEVKEAFKRTFSLDTIAVNHYEADERDLHEVWGKLIAAEAALVEQFFALPFEELHTPSDNFRELITSFIELKDSLVAREQLAHLINYIGNRFLQNLKQKV